MDLFTTCLACREILTVTDEFAPAVHGLCADRYQPTMLEQLIADFVAAVEAGHTDDADRLEAQAMAIHTAPPRLGEAALVYASWGWPVFPLKPGDKAPMTRHGFKDATTDPAVIRRWWSAAPGANIGLPTGHAFDVIDVDPAGWPAWREMVAADALPPVHGLVCTSRAGLHAYVEPTGGGNLAGVRLGIDYRGRGGYVVAPPSVRPGVGTWFWRSKPSPVLTAATRAAVA
ncbi:bifunctional DNA primase/polymerase [Nocardia thailandica]|uniref:bifunctional DNA primase/polymerase n=1 Tax=Nocardia thailandica TaxID=257275 RepID=UPI000305DC1C|nr:bifunctional DNA primase/polymerase [Nocardia thailandica]